MTADLIRLMIRFDGFRQWCWGLMEGQLCIICNTRKEGYELLKFAYQCYDGPINIWVREGLPYPFYCKPAKQE